MRWGVIAKLKSALFDRRRESIEDARDDGTYGDCFPHVLSGREAFPCFAADAGRGARTCVPVPYSDIEDDGWITVSPFIEERN